MKLWVLLLMFALPMFALSSAQEPDSLPSRFLERTDTIDFDHPAVAEVVQMLATDNPRETAVRLHDYVRDEIRFGWTRRFYAMRASDVLAARVGYCNTKATLFVALLRGAGIPARQQFVKINSDILEPFVRLPQAFVDHSYTEVWLDGAWHRVDSYIPHPALFERARARLQREGLRMGYGVHVDGRNEWSGAGDAFAQYVVEDEAIGDEAYGVFADTAQFYAAQRRGESLAGFNRVLIPFGTVWADRAVRSFLSEAPE